MEPACELAQTANKLFGFLANLYYIIMNADGGRSFSVTCLIGGKNISLNMLKTYCFNVE